MTDQIADPTTTTPAAAEPPAVANLRAKSMNRAQAFIDFAAKADLKANEALVFSFVDDPSFPLSCDVTEDGRTIMINSGDGVGVGFRFEDLSEIIRGLTSGAVEAASRRTVARMAAGIIGVLGAEDAGELFEDAQNFLTALHEETAATRKAELERLAEEVKSVTAAVDKVQEALDKTPEPPLPVADGD